jgi:hypothetical protein
MKILQHIDYNLFSEAHKSIVSSYNQTFFNDFKLRRKMLLARMKVTIQSFMWSDKISANQSKEDEIKAYSEASGIKLKQSPFENLGKPTETKKSTAPSYKVINGKLEAVK